MKRNMLFVLLVLTALSASYAQGRSWSWQDEPPPRSTMQGRDGRGSPPPAPPQQPAEKVTVTGNLGIVRGMIALTENGVTYYTPEILRYAGFIEGLKDGAKVTLEGYAVPANPQDGNSKMLRVSKLTIGSKDYDLAAAVPPPPNAPNHPPDPVEPSLRNRD